jgi:hemoglobin
MNTPFDQLGGTEAVLRLAERFYDIMDASEPALAALHPLDEQGRVARSSRDRFASFLVGWLGGPNDYVQAHGHPRLRMRHARVRVDVRMRDAWLRCMHQALDELGPQQELDQFLRQRFAEVADFMRNVEEPAAE